MDKHTFVPTEQAADPAPEICKSQLEGVEEDARWWRRRWSVEVGRRWEEVAGGWSRDCWVVAVGATQE